MFTLLGLNNACAGTSNILTVLVVSSFSLLQGIHEIDIGQRLVALGLLAEESFTSKFPIASS
jgi:hypothetical protein